MSIFIPSACDNLLEEQAYDFISTEEVGDSEASADLLVYGTYNILCEGNFFRYGSYLYMTNMDADYTTGADWAFGNVGAGNPLEFWGFTHLWSAPYSLIHRANLGISKIKNMPIADSIKNNALGELSFLKGWAYFQLVRNYGNVPLFKIGISEGEDPYQPRSSISDVYDHIIELLKFSETNTYSVKNEKFIAGRASLEAAKTLLAKVYLTMASGALSNAVVTVKGGPAMEMISGVYKRVERPVSLDFTKEVVAGYESFDSRNYFNLAREKALEVINTGYFDIYSNYMDTWKLENRNKGEIIWALQAISGDNIFGNTISRDYVGIFLPSGTIEGAWYGLREHWYELFEDSDQRITQGVIHRWPTAIASSGDLVYYYFPAKDSIKVQNGEDGYEPTDLLNEGAGWYYAKLAKFENVTDRHLIQGDFSFPFLRYADVLLIFAEAENEYNNGPTGDAYQHLNYLRGKRSASTITGLNQQQFRSFVIEERARELAYEADRRYDLFRWGIYLQVMNAIDIDESGILKRRLERNKLYPIPVEEINANDKIDSNNPGW
jgi:hypothetical protein